MARKKRQWLDDDDPDSSSGSDNEGGDFGADENDPDLRAERELFQNPYQRGGKRRKVDGSDDEDEGFGGGSSSRTRGEQRVNWAK
jgi:tuftelin-interacting protein 11